MTTGEVAYLIITESAWDRKQPVKVTLICSSDNVQVIRSYFLEEIKEMLANVVNLDARDEISVIQRRLAIINWHVLKGFGPPRYARALPSGNRGKRTEICLPMPPPYDSKGDE